MTAFDRKDYGLFHDIVEAARQEKPATAALTITRYNMVSDELVTVPATQETINLMLEELSKATRAIVSRDQRIKDLEFQLKMAGSRAVRAENIESFRESWLKGMQDASRDSLIGALVDAAKDAKVGTTLRIKLPSSTYYQDLEAAQAAQNANYAALQQARGIAET